MIWLPAFFPHVAGVVVTVKMAKAYPQYQVHLIIIVTTTLTIIQCDLVPMSSISVVAPPWINPCNKYLKYFYFVTNISGVAPPGLILVTNMTLHLPIVGLISDVILSSFSIVHIHV